MWDILKMHGILVSLLSAVPITRLCFSRIQLKKKKKYCQTWLSLVEMIPFRSDSYKNYLFSLTTHGLNCLSLLNFDGRHSRTMFISQSNSEAKVNDIGWRAHAIQWNECLICYVLYMIKHHMRTCANNWTGNKISR